MSPIESSVAWWFDYVRDAPSFDRSMILFKDVVQILDQCVANC